MNTACTSALSISISRAGADGVTASGDTASAVAAGAPWTDAVGLDCVGPEAFGAVAALLVVVCAGFGSGGGGNMAWYP